MNPKTLKEKVERALKFGEEQLLAKGDLMTMFHAEASDGKLYIIATPWPNDEEKVKTLRMLRFMFIAESIVTYVMLSEIWIKSVEGEKGYDEYRKANKMPCEYDDKDEGIFGLGVTLAGEIFSITKLIRRDKTGKISSIEPYKEEKLPTNMSGRMTELLHPLGKDIPDHVRETLKKLWRQISQEKE